MTTLDLHLELSSAFKNLQACITINMLYSEAMLIAVLCSTSVIWSTQYHNFHVGGKREAANR